MRINLSIGFLLMMLLTSNAQEKPKWIIVHTDENSEISIDVANVTFGTEFSGRVRFKFWETELQPISATSKLKYKYAIETIEYQCGKNLYRVHEINYYNQKGELIDQWKADAKKEWKRTRGKIINDLHMAGCDLIDEKKRNP